MTLIETALEIALSAYRGKLDKAGKPYILHPLRLMAKMNTDEEMAVALLHDVIEDSDLTADDLAAAGISKPVIMAVECLTHRETESYEDFIERLSPNAMARRVKLADLEDNINVLRLDALGASDLKRVEKYHKAWKKLSAIQHRAEGDN
jgi:(p)ppGpp synthase/HD superfamily hydrolase